MKAKFLQFFVTVFLMTLSNLSIAQINPAPVLGTTSNFLLFTGAGNITNAGTTSTYSGSVGTNAGICSGFEALLMQPTHLYSVTSQTAQCAVDLNILYNDLVARTGTTRVGTYTTETLIPGVYTTASAVNIGGDLTLDGGGDPNARFIIKTGGAFTMAAGAKMLLTNGTQAKNVFCVISGAFAVAANAEARGTFVCSAGAISMGANSTMQGSALTLAGAITTLDGMTLATSIPLEGTLVPEQDLGALDSFMIYSAAGALNNFGSSSVTGNIGTHAGTINNFNVPVGSSHINDAQTLACYTKLFPLIADMKNVAYTQDSSNMIGTLTTGKTFLRGRHTIGMSTTTEGTITFDAQNNPNSVFIIHIVGALSIHANTLMVLANGAKASNIFWVADGALEILANATVKGTCISGGIIDFLAGSTISGRLITSAGAVNIYSATLALATNVVAPPVVSTLVLTADQTIVSGTTPNDILLTGNTTQITKWQSSTDPTFATFTDIPHYSAILEGSCIGTLTATTYYRAVVTEAGVLKYSNKITITISAPIINTVGPNLGAAGQFVLFTTAGAVTEGGTTTTSLGKIGTAFGAITNFPTSLNSLLHAQDQLTFDCRDFLQGLFNTIKAYTTTDATHAVAFGGGEVLLPGVYAIGAAATMGGTLTFNAQGDPNAVFIIKITGALALAAGTQINLTNNANAANIYFVVDGAIALGANCTLRGTVICQAGAITIGNACLIEGRIFTIAGAITLSNCQFTFNTGRPAQQLVVNNNASSRVATSVTVPGTISSNQTYCIPTTPSSLTITGNNGPVTKWQKASDLAFTTPADIISSATTLTGATIGSISTTTYFRAEVQNCTNGVAYTNTIKIAINEAPISGSISANQTVCGTSLPTNISVSGSFGTILRWESAPTLAFGSPTAIANTTVTLSFLTSISTTTYYRAVIQNCSTTVYSPASLVTISSSSLPLGGTLNSSQSFCAATQPLALTLVGSTGTITKWQTSNSISFVPYSDIANTSATLSGSVMGVVGVTTYYRAVFETCGNPTVYSTVATISIITGLPVAGTVSSNQTFCSATQPASLILTGAVGSIVKWQSATTSDFAIPTDISNTLTILSGVSMGVVSTTTYYRAVVQLCNTTAYSSSVLITISAGIISAGTVSSSQALCAAGVPVSLTLSGSIGTVARWESAPDTGFLTPTTIANTTTTLAFSSPVSVTTYYRAVVQNCATSVNSPSVVISVGGTLVAGTVSSAQHFCSPSVPLSLNLMNSIGTVLKWQKSENNAFTGPTTVDIANATSVLAFSTPVSVTTYYRAQVTGCSGPSAYTNTVEVTIATITTWSVTAGVGSWNNGNPTFLNSSVIAGDYAVPGSIDTCDLTINPGVSVIIRSGLNAIATDSNVTLLGALMVDPTGSFTLESDSNLLQPAGALNTGVITVKRNSAPLYRLDYTLWCSPVVGQNLRSFSSGTLLNRFYFYDSAVSYNGNYAVLFNNPLFPGPDPGTYNFELAKGYYLRSPNTYAAYVPVVSPNVALPGVTFNAQFVGTPNNGTITRSLDCGLNGFNLTGNPYPSGIAIASFLNTNATAIDGTVWLYRKINDLGTGIAYATMTTAGVTSIQPGVTAMISNGVIKTGQGFFIKTKPGLTSVNLVFNNEMRSGLTSNSFFRNSNLETEKHRIWLNLSNATETKAQLLVGYIAGATNDFDYGVEGKSFSDDSVNLTSLVNNTEYAIQGRSLPFDTSDFVPLAFKTNAVGTFTISIDHLDGLFLTNQLVLLKDNVTGTVHNLKDSAYSFASEIGTFKTRFEIVYQYVLETNSIVFNEKSVVVYKQNGSIQINSGGMQMDTIEIYDTSGRLIVTKNNINSNVETISNLSIANQVLIIKIKSIQNGVVNKKIIY